MGYLATAKAETSGWANSEGGRMRLVALPADATGHGRAAVEIEPNPGWITYWREPGESGIPPQITTAAGSEATVGDIAYPAPKPIAIGNIREIGYDGAVTFPVDFQFQNGRRQGKVAIDSFIGLCKDVCIPFQAGLSVDLPAQSQGHPKDEAAIEAAKATLPEPPSADFAVAKSGLAADGKTVSLQLTLPTTGEEAPQVYLTGPSGYVFFRQTNGKRDGRRFDTEITIGKLPRNYDMHGRRWGILVVDGGRAMETELAFE